MVRDGQTTGVPGELTPRELRSMRLLGTGAAALVLVLGIAHSVVNAAYVDPLWERAGICLLYLGLVATTFFYRRVAFLNLVYVAFYLTTFWMLHLVWLNRLAPDYAVSLILVVAVVGVGSRDSRQLLIYTVLTTIATAFVTSQIESPLLSPMLITAQVAGIAFLTLLVSGNRARRAESEQRFRSLAMLSPVGIFMTNEAGMATYTNPRTREIGGFSDTEALEEGWMKFVHPDDAARVQARWRSHAATGTPFEEEFRFMHRDGSVRWALANTVPMHGPFGRSIGHVGVLQDVTERRHAIDELRRNERHLLERARENELLLRVHRGTALGRDLRSIVQWTTDALHDYFRTRSLGIQVLSEDQRTLTLDGIALDDMIPAEVREMLVREFATLPMESAWPGPVAIREGLRIEQWLTDPDLDPLLRQTMETVHAAGILTIPFYADERPLGVVVLTLAPDQLLTQDDLKLVDAAMAHLATEITNLRLLHATERQVAALRVLAAALERMPEVVLAVSPDRTIVWATPVVERLLGYPPDELTGRAVTEIDTGAASLGADTLRNGWSGEHLARHADGHLVQFYVTVVPVHDDGGTLTSLLWIMRDLTLEKQAQQDALRASRLAAIGELAAGVAHEVNNPLAAISGVAELLLAEPGTTPFREDIRSIISEAHRAGSIVRNLLAFARREVAEKRPVDLRRVVARAVELKRFQLAQASISLDMIVEPELPAVLGDENQLLQVIDNVITNARQAIQSSSDSGTIRLRLRRKGDMVELVVEDTGPGIPPDSLGQLFMPFFTTKSSSAGTGLGLSIVYGIVQEHGGEVSAGNWGRPVIADGPPGVGGASVCIRLPATRSIEEGPTPAPHEELMTEATGLRVLVVEDEATISRLVRRHLERRGYEVTTTASAEEALAVIENDSAFDVIISDIRMPGLGGTGLFRRLQQLHPTLAQRMIFTSGDIVSADTHRFLEESGRPALPKPFNLADLEAQLRAVADRER